MSTANSRGRIFFLDVSGGRIVRADPDGKNSIAVVTDCRRTPDGIAIDPTAGHIYWTNMGARFGDNDGSIERADLDGGNRQNHRARRRDFYAQAASARHREP